MTEFNLPISNVATVAAKLVGKDFNLASFISTDAAAGFQPGAGATVRIPVPGAVPTHTKPLNDRSTPLVADELAEKFIDVVLKDHAYSLVPLSEQAFSLDIADYTVQVLSPQTRAIAARIEALTAAAMMATPASTITYDATAPAKAFTAARKQLRDNGVPSDAELIAAVGSNVYADLLDGPTGTFDANGKVRGFEVVESTRLDADDIVAFIPAAFSLVTRAPAVPVGVAYGASISTPILDGKNGAAFAARVINDYDATVAVDRSLVSSYVAVTAMPLPVDDEAGNVELVEHGGAVRIATAA